MVSGRLQLSWGSIEPATSAGKLEKGASYPGLEIILKQATVLKVAPMGAVVLALPEPPVRRH
jgi:hypothetical protein